LQGAAVLLGLEIEACGKHPSLAIAVGEERLERIDELQVALEIGLRVAALFLAGAGARRAARDDVHRLARRIHDADRRDRTAFGARFDDLRGGEEKQQHDAPVEAAVEPVLHELRVDRRGDAGVEFLRIEVRELEARRELNGRAARSIVSRGRAGERAREIDHAEVEAVLHRLPDHRNVGEMQRRLVARAQHVDDEQLVGSVFDDVAERQAVGLDDLRREVPAAAQPNTQAQRDDAMHGPPLLVVCSCLRRVRRPVSAFELAEQPLRDQPARDRS
jgi:hypothetical protein